MCGIHGYVNGGNKDRDISSFISDGFVAGSLRGMDSSGIAVIDSEALEYCAQKLPVQGSMFITDRYAQQLLEDAANKNSITICHTRAATSGKIGINQAHPFYMDNDENDRIMVGVHNGTLTGWSNKEGARKYTVDSEWGLNHIYEKGLDAFKDIAGAFVFVWWDSDDGDVLNFALNDQRPMYIGFTKGGGMAFASEPGMLYWLMERNRLHLEGQLLQLTAGHHYRFNINNVRNPHKQKLPTPVVYTPNYHGHSNRSTYVRATNMDAVAAVLTTYARKNTKDGTGDTKKEAGRSYISVDEVENAKILGMHTCHGKFQPYWEDKDEDLMYGTFYPNDFDEMDAVIRGASHLEYSTTTMWPVIMLGVIDEGTRFTGICSKPRLQLAKDQAA